MMDDHWYSLYKVGNDLVDERLRLAHEERMALSRRGCRRETKRVVKLRLALVSFVSIISRTSRRER